MTPNRTTAPDFREIDSIKFIEPERVILNNGQEIFFLNIGEQKLLRIEFIFRHQLWNSEKPLLALAVNHLLCEGTSQRTSEEIAEKIDYYGAYFQTQYTQDYSSITLYTLNKHLASVLPFFLEIINDAAFPQEEIETFVRNQKQKLSVNLEKNNFIAQRKFNAALFGHSKYGYESQHNWFEHISRTDLIEYHKNTYTAKNSTIILAGNIDSSVIDILNQQLSWTNLDSQLTVKPSNSFPSSPTKNVYIEKKDALQSAIRLGSKTIGRSHSDFSSLQITNTILGGYFGSRLMKNIREDKGYTYGIGSSLISLQDAAYFYIASEVGSDVCSNALTEIKNEIEILQNELISDEELLVIRNFTLGSILGSLDSAFAHADKFKIIHLAGLSYDYYQHHIENIKHIQPQEIQRIAQQYFKVEDLYEIVVGKK